MDILFPAPDNDLQLRLAAAKAQFDRKATDTIKTLARKVHRRRFFGYTEYDKNCALMFFLASGYNVEPAVCYLQKCGSKGRPLPAQS